MCSPWIDLCLLVMSLCISRVFNSFFFAATAEVDPLVLFSEDLKENDNEVIIATYVTLTWYSKFALCVTVSLSLLVRFTAVRACCQRRHLLLSSSHTVLFSFPTIVSLYRANRVTAVAAAIGAKRVSNDLIPLIGQAIQIPVDELLGSIARQLSNIFDLAGGAQSPATLTLLNYLETLANEEEVVVRTHAVNSMNSILNKMNKADVVAKFLPLYKRLCAGEWFAGRVSACGVTATLYSLLPDAQQIEVKALFGALTADDTPMVRRAAAMALGGLALKYPKAAIKTDVFPLIKSLAVDDRDVLRALSVDSIADVGSKVDPADYLSFLVTILEGLLDDHSWRVRQALAQAMPKLCAGHPDAVTSKKVLPLFIRLLSDRCVEVRAAAATALGPVSKKCGPVGLDMLASALEKVVQDTEKVVKVEVSTSLVSLCPLLSKESAAKYIVPVFQHLCKDEEFEVRNQIIEAINVLIEVVGPAVLTSTLLPTLLDLAKDPKWRVRMGIVSRLGLLAKTLGAKVFEKRVQPVLVVALSDHVYAIRERTCEQIAPVIEALGPKWAVEKLFPPALALYDKTQNYLHRMTCLYFILHTATTCPGDIIEKHLLQLVLTATSDDVANVKVAAAKCLVHIIPKVGEKLTQTKIKPLLSKNVTDPDHDVAYFSSVALTLCG